MPTLLESLMFWRRQPTPQAPHQAEDKLIALKKLKESFDLDPFDMLYDRYWSNGEWWLPAGGGSIPGIGGTSNKVQGHDAYVFRTEQELRLQRDRARYIFATEPLAQAIVGHLRAFTVGCGFVYQVKEKKKFVDTLNTDFLEAMQQCIDDWIDKEDWCAREQELFNCQVVDGEWFLRIVKQRGEITIRRIEPEHITNPPGGTVYNGWYLGVNCDPHDAETVLGYYFHAYPHNDGQPLDVDEVIHFKDNVTRNVSRGVSSFFCLADDLDSTGKLIDNCRDGAAARARIAYIRSHKNTTPSAVNSFAAAMADATGTKANGKSYRGKSSRGSVEIDAGENMDISTMPSGDSEGYISAVGMMMRVLGNRWGMPEYMVSGDASNANYSSTMVSGSPFDRQIQYTQAKLERIYKKLMKLVLANGAKQGLFPVEMLEQVDIDVQAPSSVVQDKLVEAQTYDIECRNKVISPQEWAAKLGRDPEKIQQDWDAFNDANMEAGMMMQGINPNDFSGKSSDKPAKESISENTIDASGHAHLGKGTPAGGQFTSGGGEGEKGQKKSDDDELEAKIQNNKRIKSEAKSHISQLVWDESNSLIDDDMRQKYEKTLHDVIERMGAGMAARIKRNVSGVVLYESVKDISFTHKAEKNQIIGGVYIMDNERAKNGATTGKLHLDGDSIGGDTAAGVYAHEMAHAIDFGMGGLSKSEEWREAWWDEINLPDNPLSKYATTDACEGFAEYVRLIVSGDRRARTDFPRCWRIVQERGLI